MSRVWVVFLLLSYNLESRAMATEAPATLWVGGSYRTYKVGDVAAGREVLASLGMSLPWEQWLTPRPGRRLARNSEAERDGESSEGELSNEPGNASGEVLVSETAPTTQGHAPAEPAFPKPFLSSALAHETLRRALRAEGAGSAKRRLDSLSGRSRWSGALPELRLRVARGTDQSLRLAPTIGDPYRYTRDGGTDVTLEARASWHLSKLLFAPSEIAIERLRQSREERRAQLSERVFKQLFAWQRARLMAEDVGALPEQRYQASLAALEAELALNLLTDGWFSTRQAESYLGVRRAASAAMAQ